MTAQIIRFSEYQDAIRLKQDTPSSIGFVWPGIIAFCTVCWIFAGMAAWPYLRGIWL